MLFSKSTRAIPTTIRLCSTSNTPKPVDKSSNQPVGRVTKMTSMIKLHMMKSLKKEQTLTKEKQEFEFSRRYLAKMMGKDPNNFGQEEINEAIKYLLPSGLLEPEARPIMEDPSKIVKWKTLECDDYGKPKSSFYYTNAAIFSLILYEGAYAIEDCKHEEDLINRGKSNNLDQLNYFGYNLFTKEDLENYCLKSVTDEDYEKFVKIINFIVNHPCGAVSKEFTDRFYKKMSQISYEEDILEPLFDPIRNKMYAEGYGQKKWTIAEARVYKDGNGSITINDKKMVQVLPNITDRETVLAPLKLINVVGKVDIIAHTPSSTSASLALSLRLAISRALSSLYGGESIQQLRLAGFLTQDDRFRECKLPGQPKARKSAPWVAR